jgi:hypothetical protein
VYELFDQNATHEKQVDLKDNWGEDIDEFLRLKLNWA